MRRNGWKTALPAFLLGGTLSTAVLAAGGLGVGGLGRAIPVIAPAQALSPFDVVAGVPTTLPGQSDAAAGQGLLLFERIPDSAPRADDVPPRRRLVAIAGQDIVPVVAPPAPRPETVPDEAPRAPARRTRPDADRDSSSSGGDDEPSVTPDAAPVAEDEPGKGKQAQGQGNANAQGHGNGQDNGQSSRDDGRPGGTGSPGNNQSGAHGNPPTSKGNAEGVQDQGQPGNQGNENEGEKRVHAASAGGQDEPSGKQGRGGSNGSSGGGSPSSGGQGGAKNR